MRRTIPRLMDSAPDPDSYAQILELAMLAFATKNTCALDSNVSQGKLYFLQRRGFGEI